MSLAAILALVETFEPAVQAVVVDIIQAFHKKDSASARVALEAALRLQFEARQVAAKP